MQLPTPLDCINSTPTGAAEIGPGEQRHPLFLGGERDRLGGGIGQRALD
jgi:hypothetical protein